MKKLIVPLLVALLAFTYVSAQPAIDSTDMPFPNDTVMRTNIADLTGVNYTSTGSNYTWDFSMLDGTNKMIDTFISVFSTPFAYIATFSNPFDQAHRATVAHKQPPMLSPPGITIEDIYGFLKDRHDYYGQVGFGAKINGLTVPIKYDNADVMYRFPMTLGNRDTAISEYHLGIPSFGYYGEKRERYNFIDGWGTLYLPADTLQVMRIASENHITDSIYLDTLGFGFNFSRTETEYKWIAKNYQLPVLQIVKRQGGMGGNNASGYFLDNRPADWGIHETADNDAFILMPNPAHDKVTVINPIIGNKTDWSVIDINGKMILNGTFSGISEEINLLNCIPGIYLVRLVSGERVYSRILVRE